MDLDFETETVERIWAWWQKRGKSEAPRRYLGASVAGHECDRYLWLHFRGLFRERFEGRMYRLFERGRREEEMFCAELRGIGCEVWDRNPASGAQWEVQAFGGHFGGHLDAVARGIPEAPKTPHVCEFKTHNDTSFAKLKRVGVQTAKPMHYAQMQIYMGLMRLDRALYLAVNKDDDNLHAERVKYDADFFKATMRRMERIITEPSAERCATRRDDWRCKRCPAHAVCWHETGTVFSRSLAWSDCRSCCHASAVTDGEGAKWTCRIGHDCIIGRSCECKEHLVLPVLMDCDGVDSATERSITFKIGSQLITNGCVNGQFQSEELAHIGRVPLEEGAIQKLKEVLPASKIVNQSTLAAHFEHWNEMYLPIYDGDIKGMEKYLADKNVQIVSREGDGDGIDYFKLSDGDIVRTDKTHDKAIVQSELPF